MPCRKQKKEENDFFSRVYEVTKLVPYGRITSYGAIARYLGSGKSARMVGWALNVCHNETQFVPAHRVVNRKGILTGKHHFGNSTTMEQLLENEGIIIEDDQIMNFDEKFWDPVAELK
jgi:methylated-DNA-protein-cysteine methyltransferase related protein